MKKILILLSLVFVFSISCEDDIVETPKEIEVKEVGGESINFDDIDSYELGDLVDLQIDIVLPAGSKVVAGDFEVSTFVSDEAKVINSESGYAVMAENAGGETMLLGYALAPAEVKKSLATKSALLKSKATYNNSEISCRSTILSLVMMSLGNLEGIPSAEVMEKVLAHNEFDQLVAKFTDKFNNDPIFLEKINEDKEIKDQIKKIAKEVLDQCIVEIVSASKTKSNTKSTGLIQDFNWASTWDTYEPWNWHGEANWYNVYDAPFLAICERNNVPLKEKLAIANPANIDFIADFYDENGKFQDYRFVGRNSTLIQKAIHSGAAQATVLTDVDFVDGFDQNETYKVVIKKCFFKDLDEPRHVMMTGIHLLRITESLLNIVADGGVLGGVSKLFKSKTAVIKYADDIGGITQSINVADLGSVSNLTSLFETAIEGIVIGLVKDYFKPKTITMLVKMKTKLIVKTSNPAGWAVMLFEAVNDFAPMMTSVIACPGKVDYSFNLAQNKVYDTNAPNISIANKSPNDGQTKVDNPVTFTWDGSADKFELILWASDDPVNILHFPKSADKTQTVKDLDFGKEYKWQVTAYGEDGYNVKGDVWKFQMANGENQKPTKPVAMYPLGLEDNIPTSMRFEWTKSTDPNPDDLIQYKLTYFYEKDGEVAEKFEKIVEETYYDAKLKAGQTYYWNVVALDDRGAQALGNSYAFTTIPNTAPSKPVLISPTDNSVDINHPVSFSWTVSSDVDDDLISYDFYIGKSELFTGSHLKGVDLALNSYQLDDLEGSTMYYWKVDAKDSQGAITSSETYSFATAEKLNPAFNIEMVRVEGGIFQMGDDNGGSDQRPKHSVNISSFEIGKYEVSHVQYIEFLNANGVSADGSHLGVEYIDIDNSICAISHNGTSFYFDANNYAADENTPVVKITWDGAKAYCDWIGARLPTEAEWEFAARGGNSSNGYIYAGSNNLDDIAWYRNNSGNNTHKVGIKQPNELGVYDMSGNVWEWCSDWYGSLYYHNSPADNPKGPSSGSGKVCRGGAWGSASLSCEVIDRRSTRLDFSSSSIGFRLARSL